MFALPLAAGFIGAISWLGRMLAKKSEAEGEIHLMGVTIENEQRRQRMRDGQGIVVIDEEPPAWHRTGKHCSPPFESIPKIAGLASLRGSLFCGIAPFQTVVSGFWVEYWRPLAMLG